MKNIEKLPQWEGPYDYIHIMQTKEKNDDWYKLAWFVWENDGVFEKICLYDAGTFNYEFLSFDFETDWIKVWANGHKLQCFMWRIKIKKDEM